MGAILIDCIRICQIYIENTIEVYTFVNSEKGRSSLLVNPPKVKMFTKSKENAVKVACILGFESKFLNELRGRV